MDFRLSEAGESLRKEVRAFLSDVLDDELEERLYRSGVSHDDGFMAALAEREPGPHQPFPKSSEARAEIPLT